MHSYIFFAALEDEIVDLKKIIKELKDEIQQLAAAVVVLQNK